MQRIQIPQAAQEIINRLKGHGFEAYIVGGCVRDALMGRMPHDWDICTSALPEQTMEVFRGCPVIETGLQHGTVTVLIQREGYEITTYRTDGAYSDGRHPDQVSFVSDLKEDLSRRDFTINAMAYEPEAGLVDLFGGQEDIRNGVIRCVGDAQDRFQEDYLRILRTMRFASTLEFSIEEKTLEAMLDHYPGLSNVSMERICAEFRKMVVGRSFTDIAQTARDVLGFIIPEFVPCFDFDQRNKRHVFDVWTHMLRAVSCCEPEEELTRLALLFHDIAKPVTCTEDDQGQRHFLNHSAVGADMTDRILRRLKFDNASREKVVELVRNHDDFGQVTDRGVKRLLNKLGEEQVRRLIVVRRCDMLAQNPAYFEEREVRLKQMEAMVDEVINQEQCFSLKSLRINGKILIASGFREGKQVGQVLQALLDAVMDGTVPNEREALLKRALEMKQEFEE